MRKVAKEKEKMTSGRVHLFPSLFSFLSVSLTPNAQRKHVFAPFSQARLAARRTHGLGMIFETVTVIHRCLKSFEWISLSLGAQNRRTHEAEAGLRGRDFAGRPDSDAVVKTLGILDIETKVKSWHNKAGSEPYEDICSSG